jgi:hypothetical protein
VVNFAKSNLQVASCISRKVELDLLAQQTVHRLDIGFGYALRAVVVPHLRSAGPLGLEVSQTNFAPLQFSGTGGGNPFGGGFVRLHLVTHKEIPRKGKNIPVSGRIGKLFPLPSFLI